MAHRRRGGWGWAKRSQRQLYQQAPKPSTREELLARMDESIANSKQKADANPDYREHYQNAAAAMQVKRDAIAAGEPYRLTDVTEALIGGMGAQIATLTAATGLRREEPNAR